MSFRMSYSAQLSVRHFATRAQITPQTETMLLSYMFALCLRVDDYATDTETVAHDLSMPPAK